MGNVSKMKMKAAPLGEISTTLGALVFAEASLGRLCALSLSAKSAYRLAKITRLVATETKHYHDTRTAHIKELGEQVGQDWTIPCEVEGQQNPKLDEFVKRMTDLSQVPVELNVTPFTLDELGDVSVSAADLLSLGVLFVDQETT